MVNGTESQLDIWLKKLEEYKQISIESLATIQASDEERVSKERN